MPSGIPTLSIPSLPSSYDAASVRAALLAIAVHLNSSVRDLALDLSLREDNELGDGVVRQRNLHAELGSFFKVLQLHADNGSRILESSRIATVGDVDLDGLDTIEGVTLDDGDRVFVRAQALPAQNGVYLAHAGAWTRASDADTAAKIAGAFLFVEHGTTLEQTSWFIDAPPDGMIGAVDVRGFLVNKGNVGPQGPPGPAGPIGDLPVMSPATLLGNASGSPATPSELNAAAVRTLLGLAAIATSGSGADLADGSTALAKLASQAAYTFVANATNAPGSPQAITPQAAATIIQPYLVQALCQRFESVQIGGSTVNCIVDIGAAPATQIIGLGSDAAYAIDLVTGAVTAHAITGSTGHAYADAIYDAGTGNVYAVTNAGHLVRIVVATWVATQLAFDASHPYNPSIVAIPAHGQFVVVKATDNLELWTASGETHVDWNDFGGTWDTWGALGYDVASDSVIATVNDGVNSGDRGMFKLPRSTFGTGWLFGSTSYLTNPAPGYAAGASARCKFMCIGGRAFLGDTAFGQGESWDISGTPAFVQILGGRFGAGAMLMLLGSSVYMLGTNLRSALFKNDPSTAALYTIAQLGLLSYAAAGNNAGKHLIPGNDGYLYVLCVGGGTGQTVMQVIP